MSEALGSGGGAPPARGDAAPKPTGAAPEPIARRGPAGPWARRFWRGFALVILRPILWVLSKFGVWPRLMSRGMQQIMQRLEDYEPTERDVFICSYFKSGTNWTMQMAQQIAYLGAAEFAHIHDLVPWPDVPDRFPFSVAIRDERLHAASPTGLKIIKTHLALADVPFNDRAKYVCVVRDPKDVFVSSYHFTRSVTLGPLMPTPTQWLDLFLSDDTLLGSWARHLDSCWRMRDRPNVLFLTFEEMKADPDGTIDRIADLMGVALSPEQRAAVIERSSFAWMKSHSDRFDPRGIGPPWADVSGSMVRRGEHGSADELLSAADRARVDDYWRNALDKLGSTFPYDEHYGLP